MELVPTAYAASVPIGKNFGFGRLAGEDPTLGSFVGLLIPVGFSIAAIMVIMYFIIGAFEMVTSQGDKGHIVSARAKIYHSIIGFILLIALFLIMQYIIPAIIPGTTFSII